MMSERFGRTRIGCSMGVEHDNDRAENGCLEVQWMVGRGYAWILALGTYDRELWDAHSCIMSDPYPRSADRWLS